ncbi:MAG: hypothetical protein IT184_11890 [Acidobacteria bacterium]|nr:hypothetical protein [Acidobacteriota bacterium]
MAVAITSGNLDVPDALSQDDPRHPMDPSTRRVLLGLVAVAAALRITLVVRSPTTYGYVFDFYHQAIQRAYAIGSLPASTDCWACYHPPLLTLIGWPVYALAKRWMDGPGGFDDPALRVVALIALVAASVATYYCYRIFRFFQLSGRELIVATALVLALPCLFISAYGIEADIVLTAILIAFLYYALVFFDHVDGSSRFEAVRLGALAGLACDTKYSGLVAPITVMATMLPHVAVTRDRRRLVSRAALFLAVALLVGAGPYVRNYVRYGEIFKANGSAQQGFALEGRPTWRLYDFGSLRLHELSDLVHGRIPPGHLTDVSFYRSVWTTLHAMAWGDMTMFSDPSRHGFYRQPYPHKTLNPSLALAVLLLGLVPGALAIPGMFLVLARRAAWPLTALWFATWAAYIAWFTAQETWALKTKYILFLLPVYVVYAVTGWRWIARHSRLAGQVVFALLAALIVLAHAYLLDFAVS